jgi:lipoprotein-anchoring transpeptidase ErfK/SrfK
MSDVDAVPDPARRSRPGELVRRTLFALLVLLPGVPIVAALLLTAGTSSGSTRPAFSPASAAAGLVAPAQRSGSEIPPGPGALVALVTRPTALRNKPGGRSVGQLGLYTSFGSRQAVWVVGRAGGWLGVVTPQVGNNRTGWILPAAVKLYRDPWELRVSLSERSLSVLESGRRIAQYTVAVGRPDAPTPTGRFDVTDRLSTGDPGGPYGCCVMALSAESPHAIQGWSGGNRIAIHSTPETSTIGQAVSHGCVRVTIPEGQWLLSHIPLGTPTVIST